MITSTDNRRIKNISLLMKKSKARDEQGVFVVEGKKMFAETPRERLRGVYVSESFLAAEPSFFATANLPAGVPCETLSDAAFRSVSDTQTPQGVLCLVEKPSYRLSDLLCGERTLLLLLEDIQDPGNLGTMVRTGEGAGVTGIVVSRATADVFAPKAVRATMGSIYRVPYVVADDFAQTIAQIKGAGVTVYAAHLNGAVSYDAPDYRKPAAFLIGNEGNGLSEEIAALSDMRVKIPMRGAVESLNAAVSAALLMYEANRQRRNGLCADGGAGDSAIGCAKERKKGRTGE